MPTNYNPSQVGVPYVRAHKITINYPDNNLLPTVKIEQSLAVKLLDGTPRHIENLPPLDRQIDLPNAGNDPIPMVDPETGDPIGQNTSLNLVMLHILAVLRQEQLRGV